MYLEANDIAMGKTPIDLPPKRYFVVELAAPFQAWYTPTNSDIPKVSVKMM